MEIATMPQTWNDDRLDELGHRVDKGFALVDERFDKVEERIGTEIGALRTEMNLQFHQVNTRLDRMAQTTMIIGGGIIATLVATCATALLAV